ncbi:MAG: hypothetical protein FJX89_09070 [Bacteroidetes bacterium]|nr:hypothetical protein [Bacteroidota bacterium]
MKTLILHPLDQSTDFLLPIHDEFDNSTVIRSSDFDTDIPEEIKTHDSIIAMGHGSPSGLFSVGQFHSGRTFVLDQRETEILRSKSKNIFIWCYAYEFANKYKIPCFCTNMFISEVPEAYYMELKQVSALMVEESNTCFVRELSSCIHLPIEEIKDCLMKSEYAKLSQKNPVAAFNFERFHLVNLN